MKSITKKQIIIVALGLLITLWIALSLYMFNAPQSALDWIVDPIQKYISLPDEAIILIFTFLAVASPILVIGFPYFLGLSLKPLPKNSVGFYSLPDLLSTKYILKKLAITEDARMVTIAKNILSSNKTDMKDLEKFTKPEITAAVKLLQYLNDGYLKTYRNDLRITQKSWAINKKAQVQKIEDDIAKIEADNARLSNLA